MQHIPCRQNPTVIDLSKKPTHRRGMRSIAGNGQGCMRTMPGCSFHEVMLLTDRLKPLSIVPGRNSNYINSSRGNNVGNFMPNSL